MPASSPPAPAAHPAGAGLPLGIAIGTVSRAYALAEELGMVSGEVGRGTFVRRKTRVEEDTVDEGEDPELIDLSKGRLIRDRRDPAPARALQALSQRPDLDRLLDFYQPAAGMARHRAAGAAWLRRIAGLFVEPERVVITSGAQHGAATVLGAIAEPGRTDSHRRGDLLRNQGPRQLAAPASFGACRWTSTASPPAGFEAACRSGSPRALFCMADAAESHRPHHAARSAPGDCRDCRGPRCRDSGR